MGKIQKIAAVTALIATLSISGMVFADGVKSPADIVSGLTGKKVEDVNSQRASGKTYGSIAKDNGKLDEFKAQILEQKKALLDQRVKEGSIAQERADQLLNNIKERQAICDGNGQGRVGQQGNGLGMGRGNGFGMRNGQGMGCLR